MKAKKRLIEFLYGFIFINCVWYILSVIIDMNVLPKPTAIYLNLYTLQESEILIHGLASMYRVFAGIGLSLLMGVPVGLLMAYSGLCNKLLNPLIYFTYPIPKTALLPIIMLLFGLGNVSKIFLIILIIVFQIIVTVRDAIIKIPEETYNTIKSLGASTLQILKHVTIPAILPELFTTIRLSIGTSLSILFFTEAFGTHYGIGYYIMDSWTRIDYISMYTGIITISLLGFLLFVFTDSLEEILCKWKYNS